MLRTLLGSEPPGLSRVSSVLDSRGAVSISAATYQARQTEAVIVVPMLPPREVSPNWYGAWRKKARAKRDLREAAYWSARGVFDQQFPRILTGTPAREAGVIMDFEIAWCCGRKRMDDDNAKACMKSIVDGIADLLWDHDDRHVTIGTVTQVRGGGTVTVTIKQPS